MLGGWQLFGVFGRVRSILTKVFLFSPECRQMLETIHKLGYGSFHSFPSPMLNYSLVILSFNAIQAKRSGLLTVSSNKPEINK
jgi:hypothetical protein